MRVNPMTPEEQQAIKTHADAIAAILYRNTHEAKLQSLEGIEQAVRQHMLEHLSPQVGIFLSKQRVKPQQASLKPSKVSSATLGLRPNKPKR
jgi:hypothetical protein